MAHIQIIRRIRYRAQEPPYDPMSWWNLEMIVDGTPITIAIPPHIPETKASVKAYLISIAWQISQTLADINARAPEMNHEMDMEFDFPL